MPELGSVTEFFATPFEDTIAMTLGGTITPGATTVPVNGMGNYSNGQTVVYAVDPSLSTQQVFTGQVSGSDVVNVVWTEGTNVEHLEGATVIDYVSATTVGMISAGVQIEHSQAGHHKPLYDINGNLWIDQGATASAVNNLKVSNSATGNGPTIAAEGSDTNVALNLNSKGTGALKSTAPVASLNGNPVWQYLGYAQITSTATQTSGSPVYVSGLGVSVTIPSGTTKVKITVSGSNFGNTSSTQSYLQVWGGSSVGTLTSGCGSWELSSAAWSGGVSLVCLPAFSAGAISYSVSMSTGAGTASLVASSSFPAFILVECC